MSTRRPFPHLHLYTIWKCNDNSLINYRSIASSCMYGSIKNMRFTRTSAIQGIWGDSTGEEEFCGQKPSRKWILCNPERTRGSLYPSQEQNVKLEVLLLLSPCQYCSVLCLLWLCLLFHCYNLSLIKICKSYKSFWLVKCAVVNLFIKNELLIELCIRRKLLMISFFFAYNMSHCIT